MKDEKELLYIQDWFAYTLLEALETLSTVFKNPIKAERRMNRLKRHSEAQLCRTLDIAEGVER